MKNKEVTVYIDGTDWRYEIGDAADGNKVFPSVECLKKYSRCWDGCGVVKCKITFEEWVIEEDWDRMFSDSSKTYSVEELKANADAVRIESTKKHLEYLKKQTSDVEGRLSALEEKMKEKNNVTS